ncbi:hypothetical protein LZ30DRAFT_81064 [Colletotrichum cereale]|nr:hypothetical protein LZ30DRAFT_81064 [Colletotrichum cereale]
MRSEVRRQLYVGGSREMARRVHKTLEGSCSPVGRFRSSRLAPVCSFPLARERERETDRRKPRGRQDRSVVVAFVVQHLGYFHLRGGDEMKISPSTFSWRCKGGILQCWGLASKENCSASQAAGPFTRPCLKDLSDPVHLCTRVVMLKRNNR